MSDDRVEPARGLILQFMRCNAAPRNTDWLDWLDADHLPALRSAPGVRAATLWALRVQPAPWMPSVGFTHACLIETTGDPRLVATDLARRDEARRVAGRIDRNHCLIAEDVLLAHGRFADKPLPSDALHGHILAYVLCNDPREEAEWDAWNDAVHMPDMLASGAFSGVSRWVRAERSARGTRFVTLYDVGPHGVDVAVEKSAAVMPGLVASGRKLETHVGGLTVMLVRP